MLILCGAMDQPSRLLRQPRFLDRVGRENIMPNIQAALDRAAQVNQDLSTHSAGPILEHAG
jgi:SulP family sulfate permease